MKLFDVIIIGSGPAGLRAAHHFKQLGLSFVVLEARDAPGGRALSVGDHPAVALGAEFLHGPAKETKRWLDRYGQPYSALDPKYVALDARGKRIATHYWDILGDAFSHLRETKVDRAFSEYLAHAQLSPLRKKLASAFVEGFDAAEVEKMSANALAGGASFVRDPKQRAIGRPLGGYHLLWTAMANEIRDSLRLRTRVEKIEWEKGAVAVFAKQGSRGKIFQARSAIITLPIGVLRAPVSAIGAVKFSPPPPGFEAALSRLEMGEVERMTFEFDPEKYSDLTKECEGGFPFTATPDLDFSTWWSETPLHWPVITAWAGGSRAKRLQKLPFEKRKAIAIRNLAKVLGHRASRIEDAVLRVYHHDWANDPFSRGAYSYPGIEGEDAIAHLSRPVEKTLFFAGEALDTEFSGTVEGAMRSGLKQARAVARVVSAGVRSAEKAGMKKGRPPMADALPSF